MREGEWCGGRVGGMGEQMEGGSDRKRGLKEGGDP